MIFSIVGAVTVIVGLYLLLWGKEGDQQAYEVKPQVESYSNPDMQKGNKAEMRASTGESLETGP